MSATYLEPNVSFQLTLKCSKTIRQIQGWINKFNKMLVHYMWVFIVQLFQILNIGIFLAKYWYQEKKKTTIVTYGIINLTYYSSQLNI
jgi:hypothetical protein